MKGTIKFYDEEKKFGFILCDEVHGDLFFHRGDCDQVGVIDFKPGETVCFEEVDNPRKPGHKKAVGVHRPGEGAK